MSDRRQRQHQFVKMVEQLLHRAHLLGYEITFGDAYRDPRCPYGSLKSKHHQRLAIDLNLFKNGVWLTDTKDHEILGVFWESIGGTWGGRFGKPDGNHYEL